MKKIILIFLTITSYSIKCSESITMTHLINGDVTTYALERKTTNGEKITRYNYISVHRNHTNATYSALEQTLEKPLFEATEITNPEAYYKNLKDKFEQVLLLYVLKGNLCNYQPAMDGGLILSLKIPTHK